MLLQRGEGGGAEVVIVHLDADRELAPAALDDLRQQIHRVTLGRLHIVVGVADDVVMAEIGGALGAVGILLAAVPDRLALRRHHTHWWT
jgi:predicted O-methyltransferase YrrM